MSLTRHIQRTARRNLERGLIQKEGLRGRLKKRARQFLKTRRKQNEKQKRDERAKAQPTEPKRPIA